VEVTCDGDLKLGNSYPDGIFEQAGRKDESPRRTRIRKESFLEVAAVSMLALRYKWPAKRLTFQPHSSLDFCAYADDERAEMVIAGEAKLSQPEAAELAENVKVCGALGDHEETECRRLRKISEQKNRNHHRKYEGLARFSPRIFWIVGPEAFAANDPDLVFAVEQDSSGSVRLTRTGAVDLTFPGSAAEIRSGDASPVSVDG
jgi:hypothetical protein